MTNRGYLAVAIALAVPIQLFALALGAFSWCGLSECTHTGWWSEPNLIDTMFYLLLVEAMLLVPFTAVRWHPNPRRRLMVAAIVTTIAFAASFFWITSLGGAGWAPDFGLG